MKRKTQRFWNPEMECMNPDKMRVLQEERFLSIVYWGYNKSSFYKKKFDEAGIELSNICSLKDIAKIPFTYKNDLRVSQENMPPYGEHCTSPNKMYRTFWSTGTSGRPTFMGVSHPEALYWDDVTARVLFSAGLRKGDLFHHATQLSSFAGGYNFLRASQLIGANIVPAGAGNTERHIWLISTLKPRFLKILPSYANYMAEIGYKMGIDISASSVDRIFLSAEPSPPALRREIESKWDAITYDNYGLSDVGQPQSYECDHHEGLHDISDWNLTEIIDQETNEPIQEEGKEGILVYTNLVRKAMPIIRFWTNDLTSWKSFDQCPCGRTTKRIAPVYRRVDDTIKVKGVNFWPSAVWAVLEGIPELAGTHQVLIENLAGKDYLKIIVELKEGIKPDSMKLADSIKSKFHSTLFINIDEIEIVPFKTLEVSEHKDKKVIDMRKK